MDQPKQLILHNGVHSACEPIAERVRNEHGAGAVVLIVLGGGAQGACVQMDGETMLTHTPALVITLRSMANDLERRWHELQALLAAKNGGVQ